MKLDKYYRAFAYDEPHLVLAPVLGDTGNWDTRVELDLEKAGIDEEEREAMVESYWSESVTAFGENNTYSRVSPMQVIQAARGDKDKLDDLINGLIPKAEKELDEIKSSQ